MIESKTITSETKVIETVQKTLDNTVQTTVLVQEPSRPEIVRTISVVNTI